MHGGRIAARAAPRGSSSSSSNSSSISAPLRHAGALGGRAGWARVLRVPPVAGGARRGAGRSIDDRRLLRGGDGGSFRGVGDELGGDGGVGRAGRGRRDADGHGPRGVPFVPGHPGFGRRDADLPGARGGRDGPGAPAGPHVPRARPGDGAAPRRVRHEPGRGQERDARPRDRAGHARRPRGAHVHLGPHPLLARRVPRRDLRGRRPARLLSHDKLLGKVCREGREHERSGGPRGLSG